MDKNMENDMDIGVYRYVQGLGNRVYDLPLVNEGMDPYSGPFLIPDIEARYRWVTHSLVVCHGPCILAFCC